MTVKVLIISALLALVAAKDFDDHLEQHVEEPNMGSRSTNYRWGTLQRVGTAFRTSVIVTEEKTSNYHGCVGVPVSKQHVLISRACNLNLNKKLVAVAAGAVNWEQENSFRHVRKVDSLGENILVVTLQNEIEEGIMVYSLPAEKLRRGASYLSFGWTPLCTPIAKIAKQTFKKEILIVDDENCKISDDNHACGEEVSRKVGAGSPVIRGFTVYGFTDFECSKKGSIDEVFPFVDSIRSLIAN
ncbi:uncharacterized protein LOC123263598 [Cotesia glomerata]|uniref:uncharacterized protein LOC123263598 n=1 Tax=Cotesia glomerata TaxID=32391 RepID=UPI001D02AE61|nr:uncharacterized protein LOC123263598 [Cotesia glomerata]